MGIKKKHRMKICLPPAGKKIARYRADSASYGRQCPILYHLVASNFPLLGEKGTEEALAWHNERGQAENFNKGLKIEFGLEQSIGSGSSCLSFEKIRRTG